MSTIIVKNIKLSPTLENYNFIVSKMTQILNDTVHVVIDDDRAAWELIELEWGYVQLLSSFVDHAQMVEIFKIYDFEEVQSRF